MRKISANYIYSPHTGFIKNGILELDDEGTVLGLRKSEENKEENRTEFYNGIICPGFINAHCHLELSHMRGQISEGIGLDNFIYEVVTGRHYEEKVIFDAISTADQEMIREGIIAVGDISNKEDSFKTKAESPIYYHNFIEIFTLAESQAEACFKGGTSLVKTAREKYGLTASLVPHSSYSVSEPLFDLFRENPDMINNRLSVHNLENEHEDAFLRERKGKLLDVFEKLGIEKGDSKPRNQGSMEWLMNKLPESNPLLLVHNVYITPGDIDREIQREGKGWYCLCPNSNLYIANVLPPSVLIEKVPERLCIGTDSLSSNHRLSIIAELITLENTFPETSLEALLNMATLNGAEMLDIEDWAGSFEPGKRPGVNLLENTDLQKLKLTQEARVKKLA